MNNKKTQELNKTYQLFIDSFTDMDFLLSRVESLVDPDINGYGTTIDEHINNFDDYLRLVHRQRTQSKGVEIVWDRKPIHRRISPAEDAALIVEEFTASMKLKDGSHSIPLRVSALLHYLNDAWKVVHWHGSQPVASENNTWHLDEWRQKNEALQLLVDEQTADITAKNRELEIEAALERIRSSANAMKDSSELADVIKIVFQETIKLGFGAKACDLVIFDQASGGAQFWISGDLNDEVIYARIPKLKIKHYTESLKAWERGDQLRSSTLKGSSCKTYIRQIIGKMEESNMPNKIKKVLLNLDSIHHTEAFTKHGLFRAASDNPLSIDQEEILVRFAKVFEQTYTRFLDLQKAETQAREAEIELALERVRARTMAMQKSEELNEVASVLFDQLRNLGGELWGTGFGFCREDADTDEFSFANDAGILPPVYIPNTTDPAHKKLYEGWKNKEEYMTVSQSGKQLEMHYDYMLSLPDVKPFFQEILDAGLAFPKQQQWNAAYFSKGYLLLITTRSYSYPDVLKRFAKVFEQTYTRFLDLQKAEAQAREAEIELALERVRARTMGMQKAKELGEVAIILFNELNLLVDNLWTCGFVLCEKNRLEDEWWLSVENGFITPFFLPNVGDYTHRTLYEGWDKGDSYRTVVLEGSKLSQHYDWLMNIPVAREIFEDMESSGINRPSWQKLHAAYFQTGYLVIITEIPCQEEAIFKRFAQAFDLTYTRFLDLKKAETQAREAQIEVALERVRAQAMAMHNTEDLGKTIEVYFEQLDALSDTPIVRCGAGLLSKENTIARMWTASRTPEGDTFSMEGTIDMQGHPLLESTYEHWLKQEEHAYVLQGEEIKEYNDYMTNQVATVNNPEESLYFYFPMFAEGSFYVISNQAIPNDELDVFRRFSSVLSLTYRRFNDLQKAEAQAREAQIETCLERIRAQAMAMRESSDLFDIVVTMRKEFLLMGHEADYFWHMRWLSDSYEMSMTSDDGNRVGMVISIPKYVHESIPTLDNWEKGVEPIFVLPLNADRAWDYIDNMNKHGHYEQADPHAPSHEDIQQIGGLTFIIARTTHGEIGYSLPGEVPNPPEDALNTLTRFASVFDLAYQRFEDLLKAEAREKEAIKQASIDRVRAEIASMRSPKHLERITPLVWKELTVLGVPFFRCGVFIVKEEEEMVHAYLSTPTGKSLAALHIPFSETDIGLIQPSIDSWRKQSVYREEWDQKQFIENMQLFMKQGHIENVKQYQAGSEPPEKLVLQLVPFKQGMLYVGNSEPLIQEHVELMQYLASAFAIAYARYEDFVQLEDAKQNIENTLSDLKAAQNQLVHSEKMASLGELTAGIAHEIQNPLNFVNNFSDLNKELLAELKEAIRENDQEEIEALTNDLLANEEKVTHHGKRAEQIVKSMLQHSRTGSGEKELTDINALCDEYLRLSYHGYRAKDKSFNSDFKLELDPGLHKIQVVPQDIGRVLLNLINNAFQAVSADLSAGDLSKAEALAKAGSDYRPEVTVSTKNLPHTPSKGGTPLPGGAGGGSIVITVTDNGPGIPDDIKDKIFQPFFTTKPTGEGTGLGLSMSYDIVTKGHGGQMIVETELGKGSKFIIMLPVLILEQ